MIRALWTLLRALRGAMPDPRVAEAISQQRAVTGDTHSRKVDARAVVAAARRRELAATCQHEFDTDLEGTLLFCVLLVLKLTGFVSWSWWWITLPLWLPLALFLLFWVAYIVMRRRIK